MPDKPSLPTLAADHLACLSDDAYTALVERDAKRAAYIDVLLAAIRANNQEARRD